MTELEGFDMSPVENRSAVGRGAGAKLLARLMQGFRYGRLKVILPNGAVVEKTGSEPGPEAIIVLRRWRLLRRLVTAGDIGFAESYLDQDWTTPDLTAVIRLAARNSNALATAVKGNILTQFFNRIGHLINANSKRGSRRNIQAHYDLGNDFYKVWLDPTMLYSSALFEGPATTLEAAQQHKLDHILRKLELKGGERVLEIGCGWGALAIKLAEISSATVTAITLSPSQLAWAERVTAASKKPDLIDLRLQDYRDVEGQFDRIVSIEMFEAVGETYWPSYFATLKNCLRSGGLAVLQVISIEEDRYEAYRRGIDFIQKYIFPGGFLPSDRALDMAISGAGLKITAVEHFGGSYARTLQEWRVRFNAHWPAIAKLGFDDRFRRLWHYYLCYCEAGFEEESVTVGLYTIEHE